MRSPRPLACALPGALALTALLASCGPEPDLVVYCALDQVFSEELIADFERESGLEVEALFDLEHQKTVGLVGQLIAERAHPRCDVFWNNEIVQTVRLAELGMLAPYDSPSAADIPEQFRDAERRWTGFAARARILIANTDLIDPAQLTGYQDLLDPRFAGTCGVARPLTGTTLTHAAAMYTTWGEERAGAFWGPIAGRQHEDPPPVHVVRSNGQAMTLVRDGELAFAYTDTDDFNVARESGAPVVAVYPDQAPGPDGQPPIGTLLIPNTVSILEGAPHRDAAERFVDWVLARKTEKRLAHARSAQIPVRPDVPRPDHVRTDFAVMQVDYAAVGRSVAERTDALKVLFLDE
ncbi:MAG: extracellular solute-binding protein [Planctomycetes bacterium]|nr:extracellular solute-binding protein [Planctomycetota bacterium]